MENTLVGPAKYFFLFMPTVIFSILFLIIGISVFAVLILAGAVWFGMEYVMGGITQPVM